MAAQSLTACAGLRHAAAADASLAAWEAENIEVEGAEGLRRRTMVVQELAEIFVAWVRDTCLAKGVPPEDAEEAGGVMHTSGSFKLGIHEPGADIDLICVAPRHVGKADFFTTLRARLLASPKAANLVSIETAKVPIMTFDFDGVNVDLQIATLRGMPRVAPSLDIFDDSILSERSCSEESKDVLGGPRATNLIARLVPGFLEGASNFLPMVRVLRRWCKAKGIYSNKAGFLGGININLLCAVVCQLFPAASTSSLLRKFFLLFDRWDWPNPVMLCKPARPAEGAAYENWNSDRDLMPIITPNYPTINSTYNVNKWTLRTMREEFRRGRRAVERAARASARGDADAARGHWDELLAPPAFFSVHDRYLALCLRAATADDLNAWRGYVESRVRSLTYHYKLPCLDRLALSNVRTWPKEFPFGLRGGAAVNECEGGAEFPLDEEREDRVVSTFFIGLDVDARRLRGTVLNLDGVLESWKNNLGVVAHTGEPVPWLKEGMEIDFDVLAFKDVPDAALERFGGRARAREERRRWRAAKREEERERREAEERKREEKQREVEAAAAEAAAIGEGEEGVGSRGGAEGGAGGAAEAEAEGEAEGEAEAEATATAATAATAAAAAAAARPAKRRRAEKVEVRPVPEERGADGEPFAHPFRAAYPPFEPAAGAWTATAAARQAFAALARSEEGGGPGPGPSGGAAPAAGSSVGALTALEALSTSRAAPVVHRIR